MEMSQLMEKSALVDISVPETSDFSSGPDVVGSDDRDMVVEESPIREETVEDQTDMEEASSPYTSSPFASPTAPPFSSSTFNTQAEMAPPCEANESDSFGTAAVDIFCSSSPERRAPACEEPEDDQTMDEMAEVEEHRILDLTEDDSEEILDTEEEKEDHAEELEDLVQETEVLVEEREDYVEESENRVDEMGDHLEETEDQTENKHYTADDNQIEDILADTEEQIIDKVSEEKEDGTLNTVSAEENEDQAPAEEDQSGVVIPEEKDSQTLEPDTSMQSVAEETAESSVLDDSVGTPLLSGNLADTEALSASVDKPVKAGRGTMKSKSAVRRRGSKEKSTKVKQKVAKGKVSVPMVTVTAPSDQSDDSEMGKRSTASTPVDTMFSGFPKRIENTDKLPPGWRRIAVLRTAGKHAGRYDTTLYSDTNFKMRSFPNVQAYLMTTQRAHFLNSELYDFKFYQPFSIPKGIKKDVAGKPSSTKGSKIKTPPKGSAKGSKNKTPASSSKKSSKHDTSTTTKVCMTLKRKVPLGADGSDSQSAESGSPGLSGIWEVKQPPKTKARKKTTQAAKKDSPQLKLDAFIAKFKSFPVAKESKFKSSFKTVLRNTSPPKKSEEVTVGADRDDATEPKVDADPNDVSSEKSSEEVDLVKEVEEPKHNTEIVEVLSDEGSNKGDEFVSDVYLAEEQEEPYKSDDEEESCAAVGNTDDASMEMEGTGDEANKDALSEECLSEGASIFELKSEESDNSSVPTPTPESVPQDTAISSDSKLSDPVISKPLSSSVSRTTASKRSLSPSDSDVSARKRSRLWREADIEEDSSRSVGMCSDTSLPPQEEDENQNMASKVQKMHLSDSSSSKDMKDSASTSSSNCSSLPPSTSLLSPSWSKSRAKGMKGSPASQAGRKSASRKPLTASDNTASAVFTTAETSQAVKTNGATGTTVLKIHRDVTWNPPRSPFNLIQERLFHDPWKLLLATIFLHEVEAEVAIPLLWKFLNRWGNAEQVQATETERIARLLQPMERNEACAATVVRFSEEYLTKDWKYPIELHGIQQYGNDSFRIFCIPEWDQVTPGDERLRGYCLWLNQNREELGLE